MRITFPLFSFSISQECKVTERSNQLSNSFITEKVVRKKKKEKEKEKKT